jgi:hypothetical protein
MTDEMIERQSSGMGRTYRPMPSGTNECDACAGTGGPSPWEYDHHIWLRGQPVAVCGACRGSGYLTRWGFRVSAARVLARHRWMGDWISDERQNVRDSRTNGRVSKIARLLAKIGGDA